MPKMVGKSRYYFYSGFFTVVCCFAVLYYIHGVLYCSRADVYYIHGNIIQKAVPGWEQNVTRDTTKYIDPNNDTILINGMEICEGAYIVIIVASAPSNCLARTAIRETWASHNISYVKVGFIVGLPENSSIQSAIEEESAVFSDIIQESFIDSYNNLTLKSVFLLKWFLRYCPMTFFLMKADDDTYVNVKLLTFRLAALTEDSVLIGKLFWHAEPVRNVLDKWYAPSYMFDGSLYPPFLAGGGYIMSRNVAVKLYEVALRSPIFHLEDVYITGMCAKEAGVTPTNANGFSNIHAWILHVGMECDPELITNHYITPSKMRVLWTVQENCSTPVVLRKQIFCQEE